MYIVKKITTIVKVLLRSGWDPGPPENIVWQVPSSGFGSIRVCQTIFMSIGTSGTCGTCGTCGTKKIPNLTGLGIHT